jgi:hypothetical protein
MGGFKNSFPLVLLETGLLCQQYFAQASTQANNLQFES